uniref:14.4 kDa salivary protein n=1 Tax=Phlebotomus duboscqi TaxID=37738 RepID=Q06K56_PHLDU|nr:14.4 kDa salivary protein [Phlebotomus duboscqi]ABI20167.1 14.4 kDa salivary protein [Phlebotomus duboscqi]
MKYLGLALISAVLLIGACQAETPSQKCADKFKDKPDRRACIPLCKYQYYGFVSEENNIAKQEIRKFSDVLIKHGVVEISKKKELKKIMHDCAKEIKKKARAEEHWLNCRSIVDYYKCVMTNKLIGPQRFDRAIEEHDKSLNV